MIVQSKGVDSGDYTWPPGSETNGGALVDVPKRFDVQTASEQHAAEIERLQFQIDQLKAEADAMRSLARRMVEQLHDMAKRLADDGK